VKLIGIPIKHVIQITECFKTAFDFFLDFFLICLWFEWNGFKSINPD